MGGVPEILEQCGKNVDIIVNSQRADGSWPFVPRNKHAEALGKKDATEIGICTEQALPLLKYARITGDEGAVSASIRALDRMTRFRIPRAAQVWEITLHSPDVLASAGAIHCFIEGYLLTGNQKYLDEAVRWARTSLPFIYLWDNGQSACFPYASIAVLGSTYWRDTWIGRPVQWCSVSLAKSLLRLTEYDTSRDWRRLAEGLVESATLQLMTEGEFKGMLPDFYLYDSDRGDGPMINPAKVYRELLVLKGRKPYIRTSIITIGDRNVHVSTGSEMSMSPRDATGESIGFALSDPLFNKSFVYVAGGDAPKTVSIDGRTVQRVANVDAADEGWTMTGARGLYLKLSHAAAAEIKIEYPQ